MASMNALAAAAASGPSIERAVTLDALDGRIVQYHYGTLKLSLLIEGIASLIAKCGKDQRLIPLTNNILLLSGPLFNINDLIYKKFEILNNGGTFNSKQPIQSPVNTNLINFDLFENLTNYDTTRKQVVPDYKKSMQTLNLFKDLASNALDVYKERLKQAIVERNAYRLPGPDGKPTAFNFGKLQDLATFPELETIPLFVHEDELIKGPKNEDEIKLVLQNIDMSSIQIINNALDKVLIPLQSFIRAIEKCKTKQDLQLLENWEYSVHRSLFALLRLADLYAIVRKFGKRIFFQDYHYLKALSQYYKVINERLASLESCFNAAKKSNLLLASITRLTRQGAKLQVRPESLLSLARDARNAYVIVQESNKSLKELLKSWSVAANDFSTKHGTNTSMTALREKAKNDVLKARLQQSKQAAEDRKHIAQRLEKLYVDPSKNKADVENQAKLMKKIEDQAKEDRLILEALEADAIDGELSPFKSSRSSSISNGSSASSLTLQQSSSPIMLSRTSSLQRRSATSSPTDASIQQINRRNSVILSSPTPRAKQDTLNRRHSVTSKSLELNGANFYHTPTKVNSSTSSLRSSVTSTSSIESASSNTSSISPVARALSPATKTRISDQPLRRSASLQHPSATARSSAAAGAGAAFVNRKGAQQEKSNSMQGSSQLLAKRFQVQPQDHAGSPTHVFAAPTAPAVKQMTAQERLQAHILNQSKSGNMTVKSLPDRPKVVYKSFAPKLSSPTSSIDSGSRSNSLTKKSNQFLSASSPTNSRASSLQSISESPLAGTLNPGSTMSPEADSLTLRMNRSRSNSLQNDEIQAYTLSPSNSFNRGGNRVRSNSASKKPSIGITKIEEDKSATDLHINFDASSSDSISLDQNTPPTVKDDVKSSITVTHKELDPPVMKKVRFIGVPKYDASEDAPSPNKAFKNIRKVVFRTSSGVEITKKKDKIFTSQEGAAFRAFNHQGESTWEGFGAANQKQNQIPTMRNLAQPQNGKRLSKLFKTR